MFSRKIMYLALPLLAAVVLLSLSTAQELPKLPPLDSASAIKEGNWKVAYEKLHTGLLDKSTPVGQRGKALREAVNCLARLNRVSEADAFVEQVIEAYPDDGDVLRQAALAYQNLPRYGSMVAGEFRRGSTRGRAKVVNCFERDRVRAVQLLYKSIETGHAAREAAVWTDLADALFGRRYRHQAWQLQILTSLEKLPDYHDGWSRGGGTQGAPVDEQGTPIFYNAPADWQTAENDGQRWRWALEQYAKLNDYHQQQVLMRRADFLHSQFGVETLANVGRLLMQSDQQTEEGKTGTFALHTLEENETIAKLATGVRRLTLPDEHNHVKLFRQAMEAGGDADKSYKANAASWLTRVFKDRRQYPKAAECCRVAIDNTQGARQGRHRKELKQILGNWGQFGATRTQPAGQGATVDFRFRNGKSVELVARRVKVRQLLADVKQYIDARPTRIDRQKTYLRNLGRRFLEQDEKKYLGEEVAKWTLELKPPANHIDTQITVTTPLQESGAYWLTAKMADGNVSHTLLWIADTAILRKPLNGKHLYFVADAVTGQPIAGATLEMFGFRQRRVNRRPNRYEVDTLNFAETTDVQGLAEVEAAKNDAGGRYRWLAIATTPDGRHAFLGFDNLSPRRLQHGRHDLTRAFVISDRPVYRPGQKVHYKAWIQRARYGKDQGEQQSEFAHKSFRIELFDGRNDKVQTATLTANAYGAVEGEYDLPEGATLGMYRLNIIGHGGGHFRVEEYKKPEYEVTVDVPDEPLKLGEKFTATVNARYYFGAPVVNATVKYKVTRTKRDAVWFPPRPWDWLYGSGYWWFSSDYHWYPGFAEWGCRCPTPSWWGWQQPDPPEIVAEGEASLDSEGKLEIPIDTALAKTLHGGSDHNYHVEAQVVDESRRTIVGGGDVLVAQQPFKNYVWTHRGHYRVGDTVDLSVATRRPDGKPTEQTGMLRLLKLEYPGDGKPPKEIEVRKWDLATDAQGVANLRFKASEPGQFRLSYRVKLEGDQVIEGGHVFTIAGAGFDGSNFTFNDLELIPDKQEYKPGEKVRLQINTNRTGASVLLFVRPEGGTYPKPRLVKISGKSRVVEIEVARSDMPNLLVEAATIHGARVHQVLKDIAVPPESKVLNVELVANSQAYKPGQEATVKLKLTDAHNKPIVGDTALTIYDKSVEYIAGGSNVGDIRKFYWDWRRHHRPARNDSLARRGYHLTPRNTDRMQYLGTFGRRSTLDLVVSQSQSVSNEADVPSMSATPTPMARALPPGEAAAGEKAESAGLDMAVNKNAASGAGGLVEPTVRKEFADTALWRGSIVTNQDGIAEVTLNMPENLTTWKIVAWSMGHGARVGSGEVEVVTRKDLLVRLQTPRFLVERDEVVLSANVHNYLDKDKKVTVRLELDGPSLEAPSQLTQAIEVPADGDRRVDWRVKATSEGTAIVRAVALTDEESDAMQLEFPVAVHGFEKLDSYSGVIATDGTTGTFEIDVPKERRPEQTRLVVQYSPTLAGAMIDALPYLIDYPHGCTEQTLNRFVPAVVTQQTLKRMGVDLAAIQKQQTNLNPQELGDLAERRDGWKRFKRNPVFDQQELETIVKTGVRRLQDMQLTDGGWGWFSGYGERSSAHTTATVVRGLLVAKQNGAAIVPGVVDRGVAWLTNHQQSQLDRLANINAQGNVIDKHKPAKRYADNLDALVYLILVEAGKPSQKMSDYLNRDRTRLAPYSLAMFGLALHKQGNQVERRDMVIRNLKQFVVTDAENQTAYLNLPGGYWWYWYGSEFEAHAYFLKLLAATEPKSDLASGLVKYLLNNRKHSTYWNSTRDTALVVEAMADYLAATDEGKPNQTVEVWLDGEKRKEVKITADNLLAFDNTFVVQGAALQPGRHTVELRKAGTGRLYYNGYLSNFTLEDDIPRAGLEVRVKRDIYRLERIESEAKVAGQRGQVVAQAVEKYQRHRVTNLASVKSGDLIEVELTLDSKNDYEYLMVTDHKAAGFEPVEVRSGYNGNEIGAYVEYRDATVNLFVRRLARGQRSVSYRLRAETPGTFSALPTVIQAMYAPELRGNSDEVKVRVVEEK